MEGQREEKRGGEGEGEGERGREGERERGRKRRGRERERGVGRERSRRRQKEAGRDGRGKGRSEIEGKKVKQKGRVRREGGEDRKTNSDFIIIQLNTYTRFMKPCFTARSKFAEFYICVSRRQAYSWAARSSFHCWNVCVTIETIAGIWSIGCVGRASRYIHVYVYIIYILSVYNSSLFVWTTVFYDIQLKLWMLFMCCRVFLVGGLRGKFLPS